MGGRALSFLQNDEMVVLTASSPRRVEFISPRIYRKYMTYKILPLAQLVINPNNDRHGPQATEKDAIKWLFRNKLSEMKGLAKDIVEQGRVLDAPLVKKHNGKFIVFDGNRRTTCLKLIVSPKAAPKEVRKFFEYLNESIPKDFPVSIECQVETDQNVIDKILERRHNGKLNGEGQIKWDTRAKANHANRIGGKSAYPIANEVEAYLSKKGYPNSEGIPLSNLSKILDTKIRLSRVGLKLNDGNKLEFTKPERDVYPLLVKIADDLISGKLSLKQLLLSEDKNTYLDSLSKQGFSLNKTENSSTKQSSPQKAPKKKSKLPSRKTKIRRTLIPQDIEYTLEWRQGQSKLKLLWEQLQYQLIFETHTLSIAIVFRVFIEQITENFRVKHKLKQPKSLQQSIVKASDKLREIGIYDDKQHSDITRKAQDQNSLSSIVSLHRALHSQSDVPSESDLISLWDCMEPFILGVLKK